MKTQFHQFKMKQIHKLIAKQKVRHMKVLTGVQAMNEDICAFHLPSMVEINFLRKIKFRSKVMFEYFEH